MSGCITVGVGVSKHARSDEYVNWMCADYVYLNSCWQILTFEDTFEDVINFRKAHSACVIHNCK